MRGRPPRPVYEAFPLPCAHGTRGDTRVAAFLASGKACLHCSVEMVSDSHPWGSVWLPPGFRGLPSPGGKGLACISIGGPLRSHDGGTKDRRRN